MSGEQAHNAKAPSRWARLRNSRGFHDIRLYLIFVGVAAVFWLILALNDDAQADFDVRVEVTGKPDSVTFINEPPAIIHVSVRDKGSALFRRHFMSKPVLHLDFREYAHNGHFRVSRAALSSGVKAIFGTQAVVGVTSADSISTAYSTRPARVVPIKVRADLTTALGKVVNGGPQPEVKSVQLFSAHDNIDTITAVYTEPIVKRDLVDPRIVDVALHPIPGVRMIPDRVRVRIPVEPLENRKAFVPVRVYNVPIGEKLALFPAKVEVNYLVPMSHGDEVGGFNVSVNYLDIVAGSKRLPVDLIKPLPRGVESASIEVDSIEFTIIRDGF